MASRKSNARAQKNRRDRPATSRPVQGDQQSHQRAAFQFGVRDLVVILASAAAGVGGVFLWHTVSEPAVATPLAPEAVSPQLAAYLAPFLASARAAPRDPAQHVELGLIYEANEMWAEAEFSFATAAQLEPEEPMAFYHQAIALRELGQTEAASDLFARITSQQPDFAPAELQLGLLLLDRGESAAAEEHFQRVLALAPEEPAGHVGLAEVRLQQEAYKEAAELLEAALSLSPRDDSIRYRLGLAYRGLGRVEDARRELAAGGKGGKPQLNDAWSRRLPEHAKGLARQLRFGIVLLNMGQPSAAVDVFEEARRWHPDNPDVLNNLGVAQMRSGQVVQARETFERVQQIAPDRHEAIVNLAMCSLMQQQHTQALEYADEAVEIAPHVAEVYSVRASCLEAFDRLDEAYTAREEAIRLAPRNADFQRRMGLLCLKLQRTADAIEHFASAVALAPHDLDGHLGLCDAYLANGEPNRARELLESVRGRAPRDRRVSLMAAHLEADAERRGLNDGDPMTTGVSR